MTETVAAPHFPLAALLWPHRVDGSSGVLPSRRCNAIDSAVAKYFGYVRRIGAGPRRYATSDGE